jgi:hypothetical protein
MRDLYDSENGARVINKILQRALKSVLKGRDETKPTVVTFTGGMGAQIISAAIYFSKRRVGEVVFADLSYFDAPEHMAAAGNPGDCSHWGWQLGAFGLERQSFETAPDAVRRNAKIVPDGAEKLQMGLAALAEPEAQEIFKIPHELPESLPLLWPRDFLCLHIRRGDYVNVASYLVSDEEFIQQATKFSGLLSAVVVVSDSLISLKVRKAMSKLFDQAIYLDQADVFTSHRIMRKARVFICSNSQFSLIAAMLNRTALVLIPKQWYSGNDRVLEKPLQSLCAFQLIS